MAASNNAATSPHRCPMWWPDWKSSTAMTTPCTMLDHTVNQIRLMLASGRRAALQKNGQGRVHADDDEVVGLVTP